MKPAFWIFLLTVIISSCTSQDNTNLAFKLSPEETLSAILSEESLVSPNEVLQLIKNTPAEYQLIDLRPQSEFVKGHLEGAINIPTQYLFEPDNLVLVTDPSRNTILYGQDQLEANGPWVLLRQLGYDHLKVMQGGYNYLETSAEDYVAEQARYDYPVIFNLAVEKSNAALKTHPKPKRIPPKQVVLKKKKRVEEEEEEGC